MSSLGPTQTLKPPRYNDQFPEKKSAGVMGMAPILRTVFYKPQQDPPLDIDLWRRCLMSVFYTGSVYSILDSYIVPTLLHSFTTPVSALPRFPVPVKLTGGIVAAAAGQLSQTWAESIWTLKYMSWERTGWIKPLWKEIQQRRIRDNFLALQAMSRFIYSPCGLGHGSIHRSKWRSCLTSKPLEDKLMPAPGMLAAPSQMLWPGKQNANTISWCVC